MKKTSKSKNGGKKQETFLSIGNPATQPQPRRSPRLSNSASAASSSNQQQQKAEILLYGPLLPIVRLNPSAEELYRSHSGKRRETLRSSSPFFQGLEEETHSCSSTFGEKTEFVGDLPSLVAAIASEKRGEQLNATAQLMELLSADDYPTIDEALLSELVQHLVALLRINDSQLQYQVVRVLKNIAFGTSDSTRVVIDFGAIPVLAELLNSPSDDVRGQAMWALGNIAADSSTYRKLVLCHDVLPQLLKLLNDNNFKLSLLRIGTWTLSKLCYGDTFGDDFDALKVFQSLLRSQDEQVLSEAFWAMALICHGDSSNPLIGKFIFKKSFLKAIKLLYHPSLSVVYPALLTLMSVCFHDRANFLTAAFRAGLFEALITLIPQLEEGTHIRELASDFAESMRGHPILHALKEMEKSNEGGHTRTAFSNIKSCW